MTKPAALGPHRQGAGEDRSSPERAHGPGPCGRVQRRRPVARHGEPRQHRTALGPHRQGAGKTAPVLSGHTSSVNAVAFSGDGLWLVTGSYDKTAQALEPHRQGAGEDRSRSERARELCECRRVQRRRPVARHGEPRRHRAALGSHRQGAGEDRSRPKRARGPRRCGRVQRRRPVARHGER